MRLLISFLACLWLALPVHGQTPKPAKANYSITHKMQNTYDPRLQPYSGLELSGTFNVWYLLGEAAVNCTARWENPGVLQVIMEDGTRVLSEPGEEDMWNLMLMAQFPNPDKKAKRFTNGGGAHLSIFCDAGIVAQNGNNGFNVAGSPNWDKFICATPKKVDPRYTFDVNREATDSCGAIGGDWLSPAEAKQVAIAGVKVDDISVLSVELSASETLRRAEKIRWRKTSHTFKQSRASSLLSRLRTKNQQQALGFAQRQYDLNTKANNPGPQDLKNYDAFIKALENALAENGPTTEWREKQRSLVSAQLERVEKVDRSLRVRDAELVGYHDRLANLKASEPEGPKNPLAEYIVETHSLEPYYKGYKGTRLRNIRTGEIFQPTKEHFSGSYKGLVGDSGTKYDIYVGRRHGFEHGFLVDKNGKRLSSSYGGYPQIHEELGIISFLRGDGQRDRASLAIYSLVEKSELYDSFKSPISDAYRNKQLLRHQNPEGSSYTLPRDRYMVGYRARINGRLFAYGLSRSNPGYSYRSECTAKTANAEVPGVMPGFMFDIEANRLLPPSEHLCVPNPTETPS